MTVESGGSVSAYPARSRSRVKVDEGLAVSDEARQSERQPRRVEHVASGLRLVRGQADVFEPSAKEELVAIDTPAGVKDRLASHEDVPRDR